MRNFFFNLQQKQPLPMPMPMPLHESATQSAPIETSIYNRQILTRNIEISQPIFSVSAIFGLKQGSCHSCGH
jgi:hypothetical protein